MAIRRKAQTNMKYLSPTPGPSSPMTNWSTEILPEVGDLRFVVAKISFF